MTTVDASPRQAFVSAQVAALAPLDFLLVGVPVEPFDAVQVLKEDDGTLALAVSPRDVAVPFSPEQQATLVSLGFHEPAAEGPGPGAWKVTVAAEATGAGADAPAEAASALVDAVLVQVFAVEAATPVDVRHGTEREVRMAEQQLATIRTAIEPVLTGLLGKPVPQDDDGDYLVDLGPVRVFVAPRVLPGRPPPIIRVFAITNAGMSLTPELGLFLSRLNFSLMFGRFSIDADNAAIWFDETLLGEHVTEEELRFTVEMVASTANEWDQKIAATFGGRPRQPDAPPTGDGVESPSNKPGAGGYL